MIEHLEKSIRDYEEEIKTLEKNIVERSEQYKKELEEKDTAINEQRKLFEDMSVRFQHILQRTANKLQERVNMGS
jgi:peptidoglycan hydrolase CwlO-like protein